MRTHLHRRRVERIRLFPPLPAEFDGQFVELLEVSLHGARIQHADDFEADRVYLLVFSWGNDRLEIECEIARTVREAYGTGERRMSGLRFAGASKPSVQALHRIIGRHVEEALDQQTANAFGTEPLPAEVRGALQSLFPAAADRATLRIQEDRDLGYTRFTYLADGSWERVRTWQPDQPEEGFTIWSFEEGEDADELCRIYASADDALRNLIRMCAELSLFVDDDALPPQYFEP
jgi:hypothetical protein